MGNLDRNSHKNELTNLTGYGLISSLVARVPPSPGQRAFSFKCENTENRLYELLGVAFWHPPHTKDVLIPDRLYDLGYIGKHLAANNSERHDFHALEIESVGRKSPAVVL